MTALALESPAMSAAAFVRAHWRAAFLVAAMLVLWVFAGISLALNGSGPGFNSPLGRTAAPPAATARLRAQAEQMSATQLKQIAPQDALALNASIPISNAANPAARPFVLSGSAADRARSLDCLTAAIYYEAALEPVDGQRAVAQVVLNRVRHPAYPATVCGVVFEGARRITGCQFTFSCDGSLRRAPMASYWDRARQVAQAALSGYVYAPVGWSTHYHANYVVPYWAPTLVKAATVGNHIFYRWRGGWGRAPAFVNRYAGVEPAIAWRGGFGQPTPAERLAAAAAAGERDELAAEAAQGAAPIGSVDSFQRAVLRRYEAPLNRDSARQLINEQVGASRTITNSGRWALTGADDRASTPEQRPLGRWGAEPAESPRNNDTSAAAGPATTPTAPSGAAANSTGAAR